MTTTKQSVKILYHANCDDGFGSAYAAYYFFKDKEHEYEVEYIPVSYGQTSPTIDSKDIVYIVDFSYKRESIEMINFIAKQLVVLDHHKTAEADLKGLDYAIFDMNRSGAMITWEYFHRKPAPLLIQYIQDNDLWTHKLEHSKLITRWIRSYPMEFGVWDYLAGKLAGDYMNVVDQARAIDRYFNQQVEFNQQHASYMTDKQGRKLCLVNCNATFTSELLHKLIKDKQLDYGVSWFNNSKDDNVLSFRGDGKTDVSEIAKSLGGGGHKSAAGVVGQIKVAEFIEIYIP